ncbi:MAG: ATP-binding cassette domain-containing protein [Erysipelotrichaceae bacterium]
MLKIEHIKKTFNKGSANEVVLYTDLNVEIKKGEFVTIIGSNGSGKSTFFNVISGNIIQDSGKVLFNDKDISHLEEHKRSQFIGRVFQDPQKGTAPSLTITQNLAMAYNKGKSFGLSKGVDKSLIPGFKEELTNMQLGLENKMNVLVGSLSGGQRQALSLLMATLITPDLLLLDEHTAALDPKTSDLIIQLTDKIVKEKKMTSIMITHNLKHAITYGDRLLMFHKGQIIMDIGKEEKATLSVEKLIEKFNSLNMMDALDDELAFSGQ